MWSNISPTKCLKSASTLATLSGENNSLVISNNTSRCSNNFNANSIVKQESVQKQESTKHQCNEASQSSQGSHNQPTHHPTTNEQNEASGGHSPLMRYKHAVCSAPCGYIYVHGGRYGNLPLDDDVWRFDPHQNSWLQLNTTGCKPPSLQEHTLVEFNEQLYLFGGQVSASQNDNSFWRLDLVENKWFSLSMKSSRKFGAYLGPTNRRGHSAVVYQNSMFIYGGFEDFRGSSNQLWEYHLLNEQWELRNLSSTSACHPEPRHSHSAVVHEESMFVYGGLSNLKPLSDLWRWSWRDKRWFKERTRGQSPGQLHGHTAIQAFGSMFVFGGERGNGRTTRSLWRLNLANMCWQKIRPKGPRPNPTTWHGAIANPLSILDEANYIIEGADSEMMYKLKNSSLSDNCFNHHVHQPTTNLLLNSSNMSKVNYHEVSLMLVEETATKQGDGEVSSHRPRPISVSMDGIAGSVCSKARANASDQVTEEKKSHQNTSQHQQQLLRKKRKSRLSFLRSKSTRPRSTYELTQLNHNPFSKMSETDKGTAHNKLRHSISTTPSSRLPHDSKQEHPMDLDDDDDDQAPNATILDNLHSDIKNMFDHASLDAGAEVDELTDMNNNNARGMPEYTTNNASMISNTFRSTQLDYQTAPQVSQRTSYAYTTPPSELNTLTTTTNSNLKQHQDEVTSGTLESPPPVAAARGHKQHTTNQLTSSALGESRFNRRENRPKSEIVQSLIDRADARIKHLYTPYFNAHNSRGGSNASNGGAKMFALNQELPSGIGNKEEADDKNLIEKPTVGNGKGVSNNNRNRQNRRSIDRSKRHTIHQTMTYYNLYFSDHDKSSNSPPEDENNNNKNDQEQKPHIDTSIVQSRTRQTNYGDNEDEEEDDLEYDRLTLIQGDDNISSSTIKGSDKLEASSSGALVGVHGILSSDTGSLSSRQRASDAESQLSLDNNSDTRTLCGDIFNSTTTNTTITPPLAGAPPNSTTPSNGMCPSSIQNALTARRDTADSGGDNTSSSFSAIAEFEEDDMLQYSSPTDELFVIPSRSMQTSIPLNQRTVDEDRLKPHEQDNEIFSDEEELERCRFISPHKSNNNNQTKLNDLEGDNNNNRAGYDCGKSMKKFSVLCHSRSHCNESVQPPKEQKQATSSNKPLLPTNSTSSGYDSISAGLEHSQHSPSSRCSQLNQENLMLQETNRNHAHPPQGGNTTSTSDTQEDSSVRTESSLGFTTTETSPEQSASKYNKMMNAQSSTLYKRIKNFNNTKLRQNTTTSSTTADSLALSSEANFDFSPTSSGRQENMKQQSTIQPTNRDNQTSQKTRISPTSMSRTAAKFFSKQKAKTRYWQLCMFVIGGKQGGAHGIDEPITVWRLYI